VAGQSGGISVNVADIVGTSLRGEITRILGSER
jgi:hypothetical protein